MNPGFANTVVKIKVYHKDYNLDKKDNLTELPEIPTVFGIFAIIHNIPIHPRYIGSTNNLRQAVRDIFENPQNKGLKKFMQGPHIKILCFDPMPNSSEANRKKMEEVWMEKYKPQVTDDGEYPGYQFEWFYDDDGKLRPEAEIYMSAPPSASQYLLLDVSSKE